jgi:hypothetical protein
MNLSEYYFQLGLRDGIAQMQKQANTGLGAAIGGGAGALGGAGLTALLAENPQLKDYLINSLIGGGLGAGAGAFSQSDKLRDMLGMMGRGSMLTEDEANKAWDEGGARVPSGT